jgi:hypothetical protein
VLEKAAPETTATAKSTFDALRHKQLDQVEAAFFPGLDRSELHGKLPEIAALIPDGDPVSVHKVGAWVVCKTRSGCDNTVTLEYKFTSHRFVLFNVVVHTQDGRSGLLSVEVQNRSQSLEEENRFTLVGKNPLQYTVLLAWIVIASVTIYALILCIRTPLSKKKWLWIIFILLGIGRLSLNWTTGEAAYKIFYIMILPAGTFGQPYGPWTLLVSLPAGSIAFLILRERLRKRPVQEPTLTNDAIETRTE